MLAVVEQAVLRKGLHRFLMGQSDLGGRCMGH